MSPDDCVYGFERTIRPRNRDGEINVCPSVPGETKHALHVTAWRWRCRHVITATRRNNNNNYDGGNSNDNTVVDSIVLPRVSERRRHDSFTITKRTSAAPGRNTYRAFTAARALLLRRRERPSRGTTSKRNSNRTSRATDGHPLSGGSRGKGSLCFTAN